MLVILCAVVTLFLIGILILQHPIFGKIPSGERLKRIQSSKNWKDGQFENLSPTPQLTNGATMPKLIWDMLFGKKPPRLEPEGTIPSVKTDLKNLPDYSLVWFGHSSYFFKINGKTFLVDPVLSGKSSPMPGSMTAYDGSDVYNVSDFPQIDYLIQSHDHYDHLDYYTIKELQTKVNHVICGLGVGLHFEYWGYQPEKITELDWHEKIELGNGISITSTPARHFSGRALKRNQSLWSSYVLKSDTYSLFIGGDSGFDTHFKNIGDTYGPFDLAILENGQYNTSWQNIHTLPSELMQVKHDLKAVSVFPVHSGKFTLARHAWDEPLELASKHAEENGDKIITPMIGQMVHLKDTTQTFTKWWKTVK